MARLLTRLVSGLSLWDGTTDRENRTMEQDAFYTSEGFVNRSDLFHSDCCTSVSVQLTIVSVIMIFTDTFWNSEAFSAQISKHGISKT